MSSEVDRALPLVRRALKNARENGYNFETVYEWAEDMQRCDADLENFDLEVIKFAVVQALMEEK